MGIKPDFSGYTGVEVEAPVLPGRYDLGNTKRAELTGKQLGSGMTLLNTLEESLDLSKIGSLNFEPPSFKRFPCISLAYEALKKGGSYPAVLNVANEQAVYRFLNNEISFIDIPIIIEKACAKHEYIKQPSLDELIYIETWTINFVKSFEGKN